MQREKPHDFSRFFLLTKADQSSTFLKWMLITFASMVMKMHITWLSNSIGPPIGWRNTLYGTMIDNLWWWRPSAVNYGIFRFPLTFDVQFCIIMLAWDFDLPLNQLTFFTPLIQSREAGKGRRWHTRPTHEPPVQDSQEPSPGGFFICGTGVPPVQKRSWAWCPWYDTRMSIVLAGALVC